MKPAQRVCRTCVRFEILPELEHHQLARSVEHVTRIEGAPLRLPPGTRLLEEGFLPEQPDALFDRQILTVKPDADNEPAQANERLRELPQLHRVIVFPEP